jgi:hypothetical protein
MFLPATRRAATLAGVEVIPLADGDLRWLFPDLAERTQVEAVLTRAAECVERLAGRLGRRAGWTGNGLEFFRLPDRPDAGLVGIAEAADVSFVAELWWPRDPVVPPPWLVDAEISVHCDAPVDCGTHTVESLPESTHETPLAAANALLAAVEWLLRRGTEEQLDYWRLHDPDSRHA